MRAPRWWVMILALVASLGLTGCEPPADPPPSGGGGSGGDARARIVAAFDPGSLPHKLALDETTKITELSEKAVGDWQVYDLLNMQPTYSQRVIVALSPEGLGRELTGEPENYSFVSQQQPPTDADAAAARAVDLLELTNDYNGLFYYVTSVDEVRWLKSPTEDEQAAKDGFIAKYGSQLGPAVATETASGWQVTGYWMWQTTLRRYTIDVAAGGAITSEFTDLVSDLPVSQALRP